MASDDGERPFKICKRGELATFHNWISSISEAESEGYVYATIDIPASQWGPEEQPAPEEVDDLY